MPDISIIIPVYNCLPYLGECIRSIQQQDVDFEIICIDDGSTDGSLELLKMLSGKDQRIRWYSQNHAGAAAARNSGIHMAAGEYISFADADDFYIDKHALKKMLQKCKDYNVSACGSVMSLFQNQIIKEAGNFKSVEKMAHKGKLQYKDYQIDYDFTTFVFKRSVLADNQIFFPQYGYYEDPPFLSRALFAAKEFVMSDARLYCYRIRHEHLLTEEQCEAVLDGIEDNLLFALQNDLGSLFDKTLARLEYEYGDNILNHLKPDKTKILEKLIKLNTIVRDYYGDYTIRPINRLLGHNVFALKNYEKYLKRMIDQCPSVYIYGAGATSRKFAEYLAGMGIGNKLQGFIITDIGRSKDLKVYGLCVCGFYDILHRLNESLILIAVGSVYIAEIVQMLKSEQVRGYEIVDAVFLDSL